MRASVFRRQRPTTGAFTLIELLLAFSLGGALAAVALQLLLVEGQGMRQMGRLLRERSHQRRALELVRDDVQRAKAVSAHPELEKHACALAGRRPVLHLSMPEGPAVTYSVGSAPSEIWRGQVLMRCGSAFGLDGRPNTDAAAQNRVVIDGLAKPAHAWSACAALLGSREEHVIWLNDSAGEGLAACRSIEGNLVGLRLHQRLWSQGDGRSQGMLEHTAAAEVL